MDWNENKTQVFPWIKLLQQDSEGGEADEEPALQLDLPHIQLTGDLAVFFVADLGDRFELLQSRDIPADLALEDLYALACTNLAEQVQFRIQETNFGGWGILAGGDHEAGSLCMRYIWDHCAELAGEDVVIAVPAKDMVLFCGESNKAGIAAMKQVALDILQNGERTLTDRMLCWRRAESRMQGYGSLLD